MRLHRWIILLIMPLLLGSCGAMESKEAAESIANALYEELGSGLTDRYFGLYGRDFYEVTTKEEWQELRENLNQSLGTYRSHALVNWNVQNWAGAETTILLVYRVVYSKGEVQEQLTFMGSENPRLVGHNFNFNQTTALAN